MESLISQSCRYNGATLGLVSATIYHHCAITVSLASGHYWPPVVSINITGIVLDGLFEQRGVHIYMSGGSTARHTEDIREALML